MIVFDSNGTELTAQFFTDEQVKTQTGFTIPILKPYAFGRSFIMSNENKEIIGWGEGDLIHIFIDGRISVDRDVDILHFIKEFTKSKNISFIFIAFVGSERHDKMPIMAAPLLTVDVAILCQKEILENTKPIVQELPRTDTITLGVNEQFTAVIYFDNYRLKPTEPNHIPVLLAYPNFYYDIIENKWDDNVETLCSDKPLLDDFIKKCKSEHPDATLILFYGFWNNSIRIPEKAPWTPEQVENLKKWQGTEWVKPFSCCSDGDCKRHDRADQGILIPTQDGWVCPCGKYTQNWARYYMLAGEIPPDWREELKMKAGVEKQIVGDDNICPVTKEHCDDECCPPGSECNLSGNGLSGSPSI